MSDEQFLYFTSLFNELGLDKNSEVESIITTIKQLFVESKNDRELLSRNIDTYLIPAIEEKNNNAEVSTPFFLRKEMLDIIPLEFWLVLRKIFEPCCGKGGFVMDIFNRLKATGLYDDRTIIEEMIYFADINPFNVYITTLLLDPEGKYKVNAFVGDTLQMKFDFKFDAVIGNPPYNDASGNKGSGHNIWTKFVDIACADWVCEKGLLVYVHPAGWRQVGNKYFELLSDKQIVYLEIHDVDDGRETFGCSTRYDWYLLENVANYKKTIVKGEDGVVAELDLTKWEFIPNMMFEKVKSLLAQCEDDLLPFGYYRSVYGTDKKWVSKTQSEEHKYPLINTINKNNELTLYFSNTNEKGHFGRSKFVFSNGSGYYIDRSGLYGLTEWAYCIYSDDEEVLQNLETIFHSNEFKVIKKAIQITSDTFNKKVLKLFKKNFYKELA